MKKKIIFFTMFTFLFCFLGGIFSLLPQNKKIVSADTGLSNISVWDGSTPTSITANDLFQNGNYYYVRSAKGLAHVAYLVNTNHNQLSDKTIYLETDIDLNGNPWTPIGSWSYGFLGNFDGKGHSIYGLTNLISNGDCSGFFGKVSRGSVRDLHIRNVNLVVNARYFGAIVGRTSGASIQGCSVTGVINDIYESEGGIVGGIVGYASGGKIDLCYTKLTITSDMGYAGGICGDTLGPLTPIYCCANYSTIKARYAGGIIGIARGDIKNCFNFGSMHGSQVAGGIAGWAQSDTKISNCYNTAEIVGELYGGRGLISRIDGKVDICDSFSINSSADFWVANSSDFFQSNIFSDTKEKKFDVSGFPSYYLRAFQQKESTILPNLAESNPITGISIAKTRGFYENPYYWADISDGDVSDDWTSPWDFENVWKISPSENNGFPMLRHLYDGENPNNESSYTIQNGLLGDGTYLNPYQIWTAGDLGWLSFNYNSSMEGKYFALQRNIDLSGKTWKPIGSSATPFQGVFDGNSYTISGLTSSTQISFDYYGLFGVVKNAVIKNLVVDAKYLTNTSSNTGVLVGQTQENTYIVNVVTFSDDNLYSIGNVAGATYFAAGRLNGNYSKPITKYTGEGINQIYDVTLNTEGGIVYDKDICAYAGEPHILLSSVKQIDDTYYVGQEIDPTFLRNMPEDAMGDTSYGSKDVIAKVGYSFNKWHVLPSDYQQIEYIKATGTQYIDTGYKVSSENLKVQIKLDLPTLLGAGGLSLFGSNNGSEVYDLVPFHKAWDFKNFKHWLGNSKERLKISYGSSTNTITYTVNNNMLTCTLNGDSSSANYSGSIITGQNFYIFGKNNNGTSDEKGNGYTLYYLRIYDNDVLVRSFIPCIRKSDNTAGLYDLVNCVFYTNSGSGTFAVGDNVDDTRLYLASISQTRSAHWTYEAPKTFKVIYNGTNFTASSIREAHNDYGYAGLNMNENEEDLYREITYYEGDMYGALSSIYNSDGTCWVPTNGTDILRDGYFSIDDYYSSNSAESQPIEKNAFCTENIIYASWLGNDDKKYTLTINLASNPDDSFAKLSNDEIDRAIEKITISYGNSSTEYNFAYNNVQNRFSFELPSTWVDKEGDKFTIKVTLRNGYEFDGDNNPELQKGSHEDKNFGWATPNPNYSTLETGQTFQNFADDYTMTLYLKKEKKEIDTLISDGVVYAITPNITEYKSISLVHGDTSKEDITAPTGGPVFGIDKDGKYLFGNSGIASPSQLTPNKKGGVKYYQVEYTLSSDSSDKRYILYENDTTNSTFTMYECDASWDDNITAFLAQIHYDGLNVDKTIYYTNANFGIIAQVSNADIKTFQTISPAKNMEYNNGSFIFAGAEDGANWSSYYQSLDCSEARPDKKFYTKFNALEYTFSNAKIVFAEELTAVIITTKFAYAYYNGSTSTCTYNDEYFDSQDKATLRAQLNLKTEGGTSSIISNQNGTYSFSLDFGLEAAKRYKLYNSGSASLGENFKLVGETSQNNEAANIALFSMSYNSENNVYSLKTPESGSSYPGIGNYTLYIYLTDIEYEINYETKYIYSTSEDPLTFRDFNGATISRDDTELGNSFSGEKYGGATSLKYDDTLSTALKSGETGYGYTFAYWYIDDIQLIVSDSPEINSDPSKISFQCIYNSTLDTQGPYTIYAVYKQKNITLELSAKVLVQNYNGGSTNAVVSNNNLASFASVSSAGEGGYDIFNGLSIAIEKAGLNLVGYQVVDENQGVIKDPLDDSDLKFNSTTINLKGAFDRLRKKEGAPSEQTYYLMPIVSQKFISATFYSGTGTASTFGDNNSRGEVKNSSGDPTTNEAKSRKYYYGEISSGELHEYTLTPDSARAEDGGSINDFFATRTGYDKTGWAYILETESNSTDPTTGDLPMDSGVFAYTRLNFYFTWTAHTYTITLDNNGGENGSTKIDITYETNLDNSDPTDPKQISIENPTRTGYTFGGWTISRRAWSSDMGANNPDDLLIDAGGNLVVLSGYTGEGNSTVIWLYPNNITLYAYWIPNIVEVQLDKNGGTQPSAFDTVYIPFGTNAIYSAREQETYQGLGIYTVSDTDLITPTATRDGFIFLGYFTNGDPKVQVISNSGTLIDIWTLSSTDESETKLYANWEYNNSYFNVVFDNAEFSRLTFNGEDQNVYLSELLNSANADISSGFAFASSQLVLAGSDENLHLSKTATLNGEALPTLNFTVRDAGSYTYVLTLSVSDDILGGEIWSQTHTLTLEVNKATLLISQDKTKNLKRLMTPFVPESEMSTIFSSYNYSSVATRLKTFSGDLALDSITLTQEEQDAGTTVADKIIDYFTVKYFLLAHKNSLNYRIFKEWTYENYSTYRDNHAGEIADYLEKATFFDYYDYTNAQTVQEISLETTAFDSFQNSFNPSTELSINSIEITTSTNFQARRSYQAKAYIASNNIADLSNYNVLYDENDRAYTWIYYDVYLMPQILEIENQAPVKQSFYDGTNKEVAWQGDRASITYNNTPYYVINDYQNFYVASRMFTSGSGINTDDTKFAFNGAANYLYFDFVQILRYNDTNSAYEDLTSAFTLAVPDGDQNAYIIRGVSGVNIITASAKRLTMENGGMIFEDVDSSFTTNECVALYSITFETLDSLNQPVDKTVLIDSFSVGYQHVEDDMLIFEVLSVSNYEVSIRVSKQVKSARFSTKTTNFGYYGLYTWISGAIGLLSIDGTMTAEDSWSYENQVDINATNVREFNVYAIYTDLVLAEYDLNLPEFITDNSFDTTTYIKRGETTAQNLRKPNQTGLKFSTLIATGSWGGVDYAEIFTGNEVVLGEGKVYEGQDLNNQGYRAYFDPVYLKAVWAVDDIHYVQTRSAVACQVKNFESLPYNEVVDIQNENTNLYTYTYTWYKMTDKFELFSTSQNLTLPGNGAYGESGTYKLVVKAEILSTLERFLDSNYPFYTTTDDDPINETDPTKTILIKLDFKRLLVTDITLPSGQDAQAVYANKDFAPEIAVEYSYHAYLFEEGYANGYDEDATDVSTTVGGNSGLSFTITKNSNSTTEIKNVATYSVTVVFDQTIFDVQTEATKTFTFTVLPKEIDVSTLEISFTKILNTADPELVKAFTISLGDSDEEVIIQFTRQAGELVGTYAVYVEAITSQNPENYKLLSDQTTLYENVQKTLDASSTSVGTFTITTTGDLVLSWTITAQDPAILTQSYIEDGYTYQIDSSLNLNLKNGATTVKQIALSVYDASAKANITDAQILAFISNNLPLSTFKFTKNATDTIQTGDCGSYSFTVEGSAAILTSFAQVLFDTKHGLLITPQEISTNFTITKTFDNTKLLNLTTQGAAINDITNWNDLYIEATYSTEHAGTNIPVSLVLKTKDSNKLVSNYLLSNTDKTGSITKLSATFSAAFTKQGYVYGEVVSTNIKAIISGFALQASGQNVTSWATSGHYSLDYSVDPLTPQNTNGYLYKGENIPVLATTNFDDFEITNASAGVVSIGTIDIATLSKTITIEMGHFKFVDDGNPPQSSVSENYLVGETGDTINLTFNVGSLTADNSQAKYYEVSLTESSYLTNGSVQIVISVESDLEHGLMLYTIQMIVKIEVADNTIFTGAYNGTEYTIEVDSSFTSINVKNGGDTIGTSTISYKDNNNNPITNLSFINSLSVQSSTPMTKTGTYTLNVIATINTYAGLTFAQTQAFTVSPRSINVVSLAPQKYYDTYTSIRIDEFAEKIAGDNVYVTGSFTNASVGQNKNITSLALNGADKNNYTLSALSTTGAINQAPAQIILNKTDYTYGSILSTTKDFTIQSAQGILSNDGLTIKYVLSTDESTDATYSGSHLTVGTYKLKVVSQTNTNYLFVEPSDTITVTPYQWSIVLNTAGVVTAEYGSSTLSFDKMLTSPLGEDVTLTMTRSSGDAVGYYTVINAVVKNNSNYQVASIIDESVGYYQITKPAQNIYILASNANTIDSTGKTASQLASELSLDIEYDSNTYDAIKLAGDSTLGYKFLVYNKAKESTYKEFELNAYSYDSTNFIYTKIVEPIGGLSGTFNLNTSLKDVGNANVGTLSAQADNFNVAFGPYSVLASNSFLIRVLPRQLYFKNEVVVESITHDSYLFSKEFTNQNAVYNYTNATEIFEGFAGDESASATITFKNGGNVAKYVQSGLTIEIALSGAGSTNYNANAQTKIVVQNQPDTLYNVIGRITKASMIISINSQNFTYGEYQIQSSWINYEADDQVEFTYSTALDLTSYDTSRIKFIIRANYDSQTDFSSSNYLNAGTYGIFLSTFTDDFNISKYIANGTEHDDWSPSYAQVKISKKALSLSDGAQTLTEVFTKKYDETTNVSIYNGQTLKFNIDGIIAGDEFIIDSANYVSPNPSSSIKIQFTTSGADNDNYYLPDYPSGTITPIKINLDFDYQGGYSIVDDYGLQTLSKLNFPFVSNTYLTSNSADPATSATINFPTSLTLAGKSFSGWKLSFSEIVENGEKYTYLSGLATTIGIDTIYEDEEFAFKVGNNHLTVALLNALIGNDTNDLMGMYYQNHDDQTVTFTPIWTANIYTITVVIENALTLETTGIIGSARLESDGVATVNTNGVPSGQIQVEYHKQVVITPTASDHCFFFGFRTENSQDNIGTGGNFQVDDGVLTISNIETNLKIRVMFRITEVQITYDLAEYPTAALNSADFVQKLNRKFIWTTDYLTIENLTLDDTDLKNVVLDGYDFAGIRKNNQEILLSAFASTSIVSLLEDGGEFKVGATFTPIFSEKTIAVTLDYGHDDLTDTIQIDFNHKYFDAQDWDSNPERTGYGFAGWYLDQGLTNEITADTVVTNSQSHTVYAKWVKNRSALKLNYSNSTISDSTIAFTQGEGFVTAQNIEYQTEISFTITAAEGYQIKSTGWDPIFTVTTTDDWASAQVSFAMPEADFETTLPVGVLSNQVTLTLTHIKSVRAYDTTDDEVELDITSNIFNAQTGRTIKIVATADDGYIVSEDVTANPSTVLISNKTKTETTLTFEVDGIIGDTEIQIFATERANTISFNFESEEFENGKEAIERIIVGDRGYAGEDLEDFESAQAFTGATLIAYININHGYLFDETHSASEDYSLSFEMVQSGAFKDYLKVTIADINKDGQLTISFVYDTFEINIEIIAYDSTKQQVTGTDNHAYVNGNISTTAKFNSTVELTYEVADTYSFVYWSEDGTTELDKTNHYAYTVRDNQTIYAIFSTFKYQIRFYAKEYISLTRESGQKREFYQDITAEFHLPGGLTDSIELYYGQTTQISATGPNGYYYAGMAFERDDEYVYIDIFAQFDETVDITVSSDALSREDAPASITLYAIFIAKQTTLKVQSFIDIDGTRLENEVGEIELTSSNGSQPNSYGYIAGTNIHYASEYFANGHPTSKTNFDIITNTGKDVYLKISNIEEGYRFLKLNCQEATAELVETTSEYILYKITDIVANETDINIEVLFKPRLNNISISFESESVSAKAGTLNVQTTEEFKPRIFTDETQLSKVVVSAYTDTTFIVQAFIKAGYFLDTTKTMLVDTEGITSNIQYTALDIEETGYTAVLTFEVSNYIGDYEIKILTQKTQYTVALQEGDIVLAKIHNVSYGSLIDLSEENAQNIEIFDNRIYFESGKLNVSIPKAKHNFEGFFTYENGAGIRYIDSSGLSIREWEDTGYILNTITSKYELGPNAKIDEETGETTISLYIYWSYLKTRISFSVVPQVATNFTAQDFVKGVDSTNSWFYSASPMYIEVSFNTDIHITAPEIYGYSFYRFVISQKDIDGTWLNPVVSYSSDIPWSTNEVDQIVECQIEVQYFAKIEVDILGGVASYTIDQGSSDEMARKLLVQSYVDTTKDFTLRAVPGAGYEFQRWFDWSRSISSFEPSYTSHTDRMILMTLSVQGGSIDLSIPCFDQAHGKINTISSISQAGETQTYEVGTIGPEGYKIKASNPPQGKNPIRVGDIIKFAVEAEYGFSISWNRNDIVFEKYEDGISYFTMEIVASMAGREIEIFPILNSQILSIYMTFDFEETEKDDTALDKNIPSVAGYATRGGREIKNFTIEKNQDIEFGIVTNQRYVVSTLNLNNYAATFDLLEKLVEGNVTLTKQYLVENEIVGTIQISVKFSRNYWDKTDLTDIQPVGSGTARNPYRITTEKDLTLIMKLINSGAQNSSGKKYSSCYYIVEQNLDLSSAFWTPIGTEENPFMGNFNFAGHTISGIATAVYYAPIAYNGLFGVVDARAKITLKDTSLWHIFLAVGLTTAVVVAVPTLTIIARKRRRRRQALSTK